MEGKLTAEIKSFLNADAFGFKNSISKGRTQRQPERFNSKDGRSCTHARGYSFEMEVDTQARTRKRAIAKGEKAETS